MAVELLPSLTVIAELAKLALGTVPAKLEKFNGLPPTYIIPSI